MSKSKSSRRKLTRGRRMPFMKCGHTGLGATCSRCKVANRLEEFVNSKDNKEAIKGDKLPLIGIPGYLKERALEGKDIRKELLEEIKRLRSQEPTSKERKKANRRLNGGSKKNSTSGNKSIADMISEKEEENKQESDNAQK